MGINAEKIDAFISKVCNVLNDYIDVFIRKRHEYGGPDGKVIINTLDGEITATPETLNAISLAYQKAGDMYALDKCYILSAHYHTVGHQIFRVLDKAGYYDNKYHN